MRYKFFLKAYDLNTDQFFKKINACNLSPCKAELRQQILRAALITNTWLNSFNSISISIFEDPLLYGWAQSEEHGRAVYIFKWFEGIQFPSTVQDVTWTDDGEINDDDDYGK